MTTPVRTEVSEIGEFGLIDRLKAFLPAQSSAIIRSIGDDAAVVKLPEHTLQLISTDMLMEGVHFDLAYTPLMHLGYKSVAVNVSDIAAMNGVPSHIVVRTGAEQTFFQWKLLKKSIKE